MFKVFQLACACLLTTACFAQNTATTGFSKGDFAISGNVNFLTSRVDESSRNPEGFRDDFKSINYNFNPEVTYFLTDHLAIGLQGRAGYFKNERENNFENSNRVWGVGAIGNYYFTPKRKFSFLTSFGASFQDSTFISRFNTLNTTGRSELNQESFIFNLSGGFNYFISSHFALRGTIGVLSYTTGDSTSESENGREDSNVNAFNFNTALQDVSIGLLYRI